MALTFEDFLKDTDKKATEAQSNEPLDMGHGTRPRLTYDEYLKETQQQPTGTVGSTKELPKYMKPSGAPKEPEQVQQEPTEKTDMSDLTQQEPMAKKDMSDLTQQEPMAPPVEPKLPNEGEPHQPINMKRPARSKLDEFYDYMADLKNEVDHSLESHPKVKEAVDMGSDALDFLYNYGTPMGMLENTSKNMFGEDAVDEFKRNEALPVAGGLVAGLLFPPSLVGGIAAAGVGAAGGEFLEQTMKKADLIKWGKEETPWTDYSDLAERVGYEGVVGAVTEGTAGMLVRGTSWAASGVGRMVKEKATANIRRGMEPLVARIKAGDGSVGKIPAYYLFNNGLLDTAKAIVQSSNVTGTYAKQVNKEAEEAIFRSIYGHSKTGKMVGETAEIIRGDIKKQVGDELSLGEFDPEELAVKSSEYLKSREATLAKDLEATTARHDTMLQRADAQGIKDFDHLVDNMGDKKVAKKISKMNPAYQETIQKASNERTRMSQLQRELDAVQKGKTAHMDDETLINNHIDAMVDEVLSAHNNMGRSNIIYSGLTNARLYGETVSSTYYHPVQEAMEHVESQMGGGFIDPAPLNKLVRGRLETLDRIAQDEPEVAKLTGLSEEELTYTDARTLVSKLKESSRNLGYDKRSSESGFLRDAIKTLEGSIKDGLGTAEDALTNFGGDTPYMLPDGMPLGKGDLVGMYDRANQLYRQTQEGFSNRWIGSIVKHAELNEGSANQVMRTVLEEPNAAKAVVDYLKQQGHMKFTGDHITSSTARAKLEQAGIEDTSITEAMASFKGGAVNNLFRPQIVDGEYVLKADRTAMERSKEALSYIFTPKELERVNSMMDAVESVERTKSGGMFSFLQPSKEYKATTNMLRTVLTGASWLRNVSTDVLKNAGAATLMNRAGRYLVSEDFTKWLLDVKRVNMDDPVIYQQMEKRAMTNLIAFVSREGSGVTKPATKAEYLGEPKKQSFEDQLNSRIEAMSQDEGSPQATPDADFDARLDALLNK